MVGCNFKESINEECEGGETENGRLRFLSSSPYPPRSRMFRFAAVGKSVYRDRKRSHRRAHSFGLSDTNSLNLNHKSRQIELKFQILCI